MPAMILSWLFGILLIHSLGFSVFSELWMQIKTVAVIILTYHFTLGKYLNDLLQTAIKRPLDSSGYITKYLHLY